jgi:Paf1 complex subunit CDC73 N-terminal
LITITLSASINFTKPQKHASREHYRKVCRLSVYVVPENYSDFLFPIDFPFPGDDYYYTLKDVIFYLENIEDSIVEYRKKTVFQKVTAITEADKKDLKDYLTGATDTCPQLDFAAAAALSSVRQWLPRLSRLLHQ